LIRGFGWGWRPRLKAGARGRGVGVGVESRAEARPTGWGDFVIAAQAGIRVVAVGGGFAVARG
jgi:hypothetical protein